MLLGAFPNFSSPLPAVFRECIKILSYLIHLIFISQNFFCLVIYDSINKSVFYLI